MTAITKYTSKVSEAILNNPSRFPYQNEHNTGINYGWFVYDVLNREVLYALTGRVVRRLKQTARQYRALVEKQGGAAPVILVTGNNRAERTMFIEALMKSVGHEGMYRFTGAEVSEHLSDIAYLLADPLGVLTFTSLDNDTLGKLLSVLPNRHKTNTVIISIASIDLVPNTFTQHIDLDMRRAKGEPLFKIGRFALYREDV